MSDRRLIEDSLPLAEISETSAREKSIRHGHISTLHLWWARRPLAAARAATLAALMPAPKNKAERKRMHRELVDILDWEHAKRPEEFAKKLHALLAKYRPNTPRTLDPFAGGGALPLEAERIGAEAYASDLNPVAHLIQLATLGYPQQFADVAALPEATEPVPPPESGAQLEIAPKAPSPGSSAPRLVAEVEYWGGQALERLTREVGWAYAAQDQPLFYVWARTVTCANAACRAEIPLVGSYYLIKKAKHVVALKPIPKPDEGRVDFEVVEEEGGYVAPDPIIKRANAICPCCGQTSNAKYIKQQGTSIGLGHRLLAVAVQVGKRGKRYRQPTAAELRLLEQVDGKLAALPASLKPTEPLPVDDTRAFFVVLYGMTTWGSLYNPRQMLVMAHLAQIVSSLPASIRERNADLGDDAEALAAAVVTYLALACSKLADYFSTICVLNYTGGRGVGHTFRLHALPMTWDYTESNPLNTVAASLPKILGDMSKTLGYLTFEGTADVRRCSADRLPFEERFFDAIVTDPPYYDAVPYSDLSDYFYVWLKRCLADVHPTLFATELTPKLPHPAPGDPSAALGGLHRRRHARLGGDAAPEPAQHRPREARRPHRGLRAQQLVSHPHRASQRLRGDWGRARGG